MCLFIMQNKLKQQKYLKNSNLRTLKNNDA